MIVPTIHLNGSDGGRLLEQNMAAARAVRKALDALEEAQPNARDYYPQGDDAWIKAQAEHAARLAQLKTVLGELSAIVDAIDAATTKRRHR